MVAKMLPSPSSQHTKEGSQQTKYTFPRIKDPGLAGSSTSLPMNKKRTMSERDQQVLVLLLWIHACML
jgi:hypothetical protein